MVLYMCIACRRVCSFLCTFLTEQQQQQPVIGAIRGLPGNSCSGPPHDYLTLSMPLVGVTPCNTVPAPPVPAAHPPAQRGSRAPGCGADRELEAVWPGSPPGLGRGLRLHRGPGMDPGIPSSMAAGWVRQGLKLALPRDVYEQLWCHGAVKVRLWCDEAV